MPPLFTLIVPTLNGAHTVVHTLRTIMAQQFQDFELIVSDNRSTDNTEAVVREVCGAKLVYIKPERRLSMSRHWEFALSKATGRYVTFIGDDDGLTLHGLQIAADILAQHDYPEALCGLNVEYHWPDSPIPFHACITQLPLRNGYGLRKRSSRQMLRLLRHHTRFYFELPMVYRGFVRRDVLTKITEQCGAMFRSSIPDVYAAIAVAASIDSYWFTETPMFIEGVSGDSNGASSLVKGAEADESFFIEGHIPWHPGLNAFAPTVTMLMYESLLQARDAGLLTAADMMSPRDFVAHAALFSTSLAPYRYNQSWEVIEHYAREYHLEDLAAALRSRYPNIPLQPSDPALFLPSYSRVYDRTLRLKMPESVCANVFDCMRMADRWLPRSGDDRIEESGVVNALMDADDSKRKSETAHHNLLQIHGLWKNQLHFLNGLVRHLGSAVDKKRQEVGAKNSRIETLQSKNEDLKTKVAGLKARIDHLENHPTLGNLLRRWRKNCTKIFRPSRNQK